MQRRNSCFVVCRLQSFHKVSAIQQYQYWQLCFSCIIRNEPDKWSLQPWNVIMLYIRWFSFEIYYHMVQIKKGNRNFWECEVWNGVNFVRLWKTRFPSISSRIRYFCLLSHSLLVDQCEHAFKHAFTEIHMHRYQEQSHCGTKQW